MASAPALQPLQTLQASQPLPAPQPLQALPVQQPSQPLQASPIPQPQDAPPTKPAEVSSDTKKPTTKEDFESLIGRLVQKGDPDAEALLVFANEQAGKLNEKEEELKAKSRIFDQAVKQAAETLERKFRHHDAETRAFLTQYIKNGGAEQYVLSGGKMVALAEDKAPQEEAPPRPAVEEKRPVPMIAKPPQQPPTRSNIDVQNLTSAWKKAAYVDSKTGVISSVMEKPEPKDQDQKMTDSQERTDETVEERLRHRFNRNSFMQAFIANGRNFLDSFSPSNQMIQASGSDRFFSPKEQEHFQASRAQGIADALAFMAPILDFEPRSFRSGSKRPLSAEDY